MNDGEAGTSRGALVTEDFDVFLNHRGPDVKATFVAHLEDALRCAGHRPFLDARSLMKGNPALESIDQAVAMAKVHVAVVSRGYAESKYCLNELVAMMSSGKPVVPVFYGVEPVDLKWVENGPFAEAFQRHKSKGRSEKKLQQWREALAMLAGITGFCSFDYKTDESKLKRDVVDQVARLTPSNIPIKVDSWRVGLDGPTCRCIQLLEEMGGGVGILGIVGMGGIGKTTLAREIYNYYAAQTMFKHMSFLEIHRDNVGSPSNIQVRPTWSWTLREQLLWDLLRVKTSGFMDYSNWFQNVSTLGPVMIVVDGVDNLDEIEALVPFVGDLHPNSRIIVTSRDQSILESVGRRAKIDHRIFHVAQLGYHDSNMLFNLHAFNCEEAQEDIKDLAKDIVRACGGLPLALKVIGSSLCNKRSRRDKETIWAEAKDRMRQSEDVMNVLRWSYEILPKVDQRMFVDITCIFNNKGVAEAFSFWSSCKECASCGGMSTPYFTLQNLIDKNLVSCYGDFGYFKVHDLLVELGKGIGKMTRTHFTSGSSGEVALSRNQGFEETKALILRGSRKRKFEVEEFAHMPNLHYLEMPDGGVMDGDWRCMSKELRFLRWRNTSLTHLPPNLDLGHITSLDFSRSPTLVALWTKFDSNSMGLSNLVKLDMSYCNSITRLPDAIGQCSQLQLLNLIECTRLKELPDGVGQLNQLKELNLRSCKRLKSLPDSIGLASSLKVLNLHSCGRLEGLPDSIGMLKQLLVLTMRGCSNVKTLPESIGTLLSLEELITTGCTSLTTLPASLKFCPSLRRLEIHSNPSAYLEALPIDTFEKAWPKLTSFHLNHHHGSITWRAHSYASKHLELSDKTLSDLPQSIGPLLTLTYLSIECEKLESLPKSLGELKSLIQLTLRHCEYLKRLPKTLGGLTNLRFLTIECCGSLRKLPSSIGLLSRLETLDIISCMKLMCLPTSFKQLKIEAFTLRDCKSMEVIETLKTLQGMPIWGSMSIPELPPSLGVLSNLHIGMHTWYPQELDEACDVLEDEERGFVKVYHNKSTQLSTLYQHVHETWCLGGKCSRLFDSSPHIAKKGKVVCQVNE